MESYDYDYDNLYPGPLASNPAQFYPTTPSSPSAPAFLYPSSAVVEPDIGSSNSHRGSTSSAGGQVSNTLVGTHNQDDDGTGGAGDEESTETNTLNLLREGEIDNEKKKKEKKKKPKAENELDSEIYFSDSDKSLDEDSDDEEKSRIKEIEDKKEESDIDIFQSAMRTKTVVDLELSLQVSEKTKEFQRKQELRRRRIKNNLFYKGRKMLQDYTEDEKIDIEKVFEFEKSFPFYHPKEFSSKHLIKNLPQLRGLKETKEEIQFPGKHVQIKEEANGPENQNSTYAAEKLVEIQIPGQNLGESPESHQGSKITKKAVFVEARLNKEPTRGIFPFYFDIDKYSTEVEKGRDVFLKKHNNRQFIPPMFDRSLEHENQSPALVGSKGNNKNNTSEMNMIPSKKTVLQQDLMPDEVISGVKQLISIEKNQTKNASKVKDKIKMVNLQNTGVQILGIGKTLSSFRNIQILVLRRCALKELKNVYLPDLRELDIAYNLLTISEVLNVLKTSNFLEVLSVAGNENIVSQPNYRTQLLVHSSTLKMIDETPVSFEEHIKAFTTTKDKKRYALLTRRIWNETMNTICLRNDMKTWEPERITTLILQNCSLIEVNLSAFCNLKNLDLSNNLIVTLKDNGFSFCKKLKRFDISNNQLTSLKDIGPLRFCPRIVSFSCHDNNKWLGYESEEYYRFSIIGFTHFFLGTNRCNGLQVLDGKDVLITERLKALPYTNGALPKHAEEQFLWNFLLMREFGHYQLRYIPKFFKMIQKLVFPKCGLVNIDLRPFKRLKLLDLSNNPGLAGVPGLGNSAKTLTFLDLHCDGHEKTPAFLKTNSILTNLADFSALKHIVLKNDKKSRKKDYRNKVLNNLLQKNPQLYALDHHLISIDERLKYYENLGEKTGWELTQYKIQLKIIQTALKFETMAFPPSYVTPGILYQPYEVTELRLRGIHLKNTDFNFSAFINLERIDLSHNELTSFDDLGLEACKDTLEVFDVSHNFFKKCKKCALFLDQFENLKIVALHNNPLAKKDLSHRQKILNRLKCMRSTHSKLKVLDIPITSSERIAVWMNHKVLSSPENKTLSQFENFMTERGYTQDTQSIEKMSFEGSGIPLFDFSPFSNIYPNLKILLLRANNILSLNGIGIFGLHTLEVVDLRENFLAHIDEVIALMEQNPNLQAIGLDGNRFPKNYRETLIWRCIHEKGLLGKTTSSLWEMDNEELSLDEIIGVWAKNAVTLPDTQRRVEEKKAEMFKFDYTLKRKLSRYMSVNENVKTMNVSKILRMLRSLNLQHSGLGMVIFPARDLQQLKKLSLKGNRLKDKELLSKAHGIAGLRRLEELDVSFNQVKNIETFSKILQSLPGLKAFFCDNNQCFPSETLAIAGKPLSPSSKRKSEKRKTRAFNKSNKDNRSLMLSKCAFVSRIGWKLTNLNGYKLLVSERIQACKLSGKYDEEQVNIIQVELTMEQRFGYEFVTNPKARSTVTTMNLSAASLVSIRRIAKFGDNLTELDISDNKITSFPAILAEGLPKLKILNISKNAITTGVEETMKSLADLHNLQHLTVFRAGPAFENKQEYFNSFINSFRGLVTLDGIYHPKPLSSVELLATDFLFVNYGISRNNLEIVDFKNKKVSQLEISDFWTIILALQSLCSVYVQEDKDTNKKSYFNFGPKKLFLMKVLESKTGNYLEEEDYRFICCNHIPTLQSLDKIAITEKEKKAHQKKKKQMQKFIDKLQRLAPKQKDEAENQKSIVLFTKPHLEFDFVKQEFQNLRRRNRVQREEQRRKLLKKFPNKQSAIMAFEREKKVDQNGETEIDFHYIWKNFSDSTIFSQYLKISSEASSTLKQSVKSFGNSLLKFESGLVFVQLFILLVVMIQTMSWPELFITVLHKYLFPLDILSLDFQDPFIAWFGSSIPEKYNYIIFFILMLIPLIILILFATPLSKRQFDAVFFGRCCCVKNICLMFCVCGCCLYCAIAIPLAVSLMFVTDTALLTIQSLAEITLQNAKGILIEFGTVYGITLVLILLVFLALSSCCCFYCCCMRSSSTAFFHLVYNRLRSQTFLLVFSLLFLPVLIEIVNVFRCDSPIFSSTADYKSRMFLFPSVKCPESWLDIANVPVLYYFALFFLFFYGFGVPLVMLVLIILDYAAFWKESAFKKDLKHIKIVRKSKAKLIKKIKNSKGLIRQWKKKITQEKKKEARKLKETVNEREEDSVVDPHDLDLQIVPQISQMQPLHLTPQKNQSQMMNVSPGKLQSTYDNKLANSKAMLNNSEIIQGDSLINGNSTLLPANATPIMIQEEKLLEMQMQVQQNEEELFFLKADIPYLKKQFLAKYKRNVKTYHSPTSSLYAPYKRKWKLFKPFFLLQFPLLIIWTVLLFNSSNFWLFKFFISEENALKFEYFNYANLTIIVLFVSLLSFFLYSSCFFCCCRPYVDITQNLLLVWNYAGISLLFFIGFIYSLRNFFAESENWLYVVLTYSIKERIMSIQWVTEQSWLYDSLNSVFTYLVEHKDPVEVSVNDFFLSALPYYQLYVSIVLFVVLGVTIIGDLVIYGLSFLKSCCKCQLNMCRNRNKARINSILRQIKRTSSNPSSSSSVFVRGAKAIASKRQLVSTKSTMALQNATVANPKPFQSQKSKGMLILEKVSSFIVKKDSKMNLHESPPEAKINIADLKKSVVVVSETKEENETREEDEEEEHWAGTENNVVALEEKIVVIKKNKNLERFIQQNK